MGLIDADALKKEIKRTYCTGCDNYRGLRCKACATDDALDMVEDAPTIDAEPVRHGRWIDEIEPNAVTASGREVHVFRCSACDFTWANKTAVLHYFKYCPNCGAKMMEVQDDD